jgi:hypothetical protein
VKIIGVEEHFLQARLEMPGLFHHRRNVTAVSACTSERLKTGSTT